jgi:alkylhydroperoxidase family enzyme
MAVSGARIAPLAVSDALARAAEVRIHPDLARLEVYRVLLHHPTLAKAMTRLLTMLLYKGRCLDERLRELVIMRLGWATASLYEWTQHWRVARELGIPEAELVGVRDWQNFAGFGEAERAVLAAVDETLATGAISAATVERCLGHVGGAPQTLELIAAIGHWRMFSQLLRSLAIPLEEGMAAWPPDGTAPPEPRFDVRGGDAGREGIDGKTRLPLLSLQDAAARAAGHDIDAAQAQRGPFRALLHHPPLALAMNGLLDRLLYRGVLGDRVRECIIMRIAWQTGSVCEWARHVPFCRRVGVSDDDLVALRDWRAAPNFDAAERAALAATDDTLVTGTISDATWAACAQVFETVPELLELVAAIGNWRMYSQILRSAGVPLEPGETPWAPDGQAPAARG